MSSFPLLQGPGSILIPPQSVSSASIDLTILTITSNVYGFFSKVWPALQEAQNTNMKTLKEKHVAFPSIEEAIYHGLYKSISQGNLGQHRRNHIEEQE